MSQAFFQYVTVACLPLTILMLVAFAIRAVFPRDVVLRYRLLVGITILAILIIPVQWLLVEADVANQQKIQNHRAESVQPSLVIQAPDYAAPASLPLPSSSAAGLVEPAPPTDKLLPNWLIAGIYYAGVSLIGLVIVVRLFKTARFLTRCRRLETDQVQQLLGELPGSSFKHVLWLESRDMNTPACAWCLRPILFVPRNALKQFSADELKCVLTHELIHLKRRDWLVAVLAGMLQVAFWFHPLVWIFARCLGTDRELSCDALVVRKNDSPKTYARTLLQLCQQGSTDVAESLSVVPLGPQIPITRRIKMLSHYRRRSPNAIRIAVVGLLAGVAVLVGWLQINNATAADLPRFLGEGPRENLENAVATSVEAPQEFEIGPPVVGSIEAIKTGRSDREMYDHFQQSMELTGQTWNDDAWITNQESIVSSESATVDGSVITSNELTFNLPEGSHLTAQFFGKHVAMEQQPGASVVTIQDGQISIVDREGVIRVIGQLPADAPADSVIQVTTTYARDEITMQVRGNDGKGNAIKVEAEFDSQTGVPQNEDQPPHKAVRYELFGDKENQGPLTLKMQWIYQLGELRRSVERNRG